MKKNVHGAYILARYSTDRQDEDSIDVQVRKCSLWCDEHGLPVLDVFADLAVSGMKDSRPEYDRMMAQLSRGGADTVVIYDQSRMFRKLTAWFDFRETVERFGVRVVSVTQPMVGGDLRDPTNFLTEGSMALFNQIWVLQTRQKVTEKMRFMAQQGRHTGGKPPLGYTVVDGRYAVCAPEAEIVRSIFRWYASGKTYREIIRALNDAGHTTRAGNSFGANSLHDLLKNEKYIGVLTYGKVEKRPDGSRNSHSTATSVIRVEDAIPAIIDKSTWETVQRKMQENKRSQAGRAPTVREYPLKGKVFCGECKSAMVVSKSKGKYYYYACSAKQRTGKCGCMPVRIDDLEARVVDAMRKLLGEPSNVEHLIAILREERGKLQGSAGEKLQQLVARRSAVEKRIDSAVDAVLSGLNSPALSAKLTELEAEKAKLEHDMLQLKAQVSGSSVSEDRLREILGILTQSPEADDLLLSIVVRVEVYSDYVKVWTLLDPTPGGDFDFSNDPGDVIRITGVRLPAPRRRKLRIACDDFFMLRIKSHLALAPLLLLPDSNPLRWALSRFYVCPQN